MIFFAEVCLWLARFFNDCAEWALRKGVARRGGV